MNAQLPRWVDLGLIPLLNLAAAFLVAGLVVLLVGEDPIQAVRVILYGAFGFGEGVGFTLFYAADFIFTGLCVAVAFQASLFNIGGEGQARIGGLGVGLARLALDHLLPWRLILPVAALAGAAFGGAWAFIPACLQARRGSRIVIATIMFNVLAASLTVYLLVNVLKPAGAMAPESRTFQEAGRLPGIDRFLQIFGQDIGGAPFAASIAVCVAVWALIRRTKLGCEVRTFGASPRAAPLRRRAVRDDHALLRRDGPRRPHPRRHPVEAELGAPPAGLRGVPRGAVPVAGAMAHPLRAQAARGRREPGRRGRRRHLGPADALSGDGLRGRPGGARRRVSGHRPVGGGHRGHVGGQGLHRAGCADLLQAAPDPGDVRLPAVRLPRRAGHPPPGPGDPADRRGAGAADPGAALHPLRRAAGRLHRPRHPARGRRNPCIKER